MLLNWVCFKKLNHQILKKMYPGLKDPNKEWYLNKKSKSDGSKPKVVDVSKINDYTDLADPSLRGKVCLEIEKVLIINL